MARPRPDHAPQQRALVEGGRRREAVPLGQGRVEGPESSGSPALDGFGADAEVGPARIVVHVFLRLSR